MGTYSYNIASDNALREKVVWHANGRGLSVENFDGENVDELIKIIIFVKIFPRPNFAPYGMLLRRLTQWTACRSNCSH